MNISSLYGKGGSLSVARLFEHVQNVEHDGGLEYVAQHEKLPDTVFQRRGSDKPVYGVYAYRCGTLGVLSGGVELDKLLERHAQGAASARR